MGGQKIRLCHHVSAQEPNPHLAQALNVHESFGQCCSLLDDEKKIPIEQTLIVVDDLALPFGQLRLKPSGSEAGHNGVKHITQILGTQKYARLRFGIGNDFPKGGQVDFVLGKFEAEDLQQMPEALKRAGEAVKSYALQGIDRTMNLYNR